MEKIHNKLKHIGDNYFNNIFNKEFIEDSYLFLTNLPDDVKRNLLKEPLYEVIRELYEKEHQVFIRTSKSNLSQMKTSVPPQTLESQGKYLEMIASFIQEKKDKTKENEIIETQCQLAMSKYYHEEIHEFFKIINSNNLIKERILSQKTDTFINLLRFEESTLDFFNQEVNDNAGYTRIKGSKFNFATRITGKTVTLRFEREFDVELINLVSIMYEVNYYCKWYPFCHVSETLDQPGKAKKCVHMIVNLPIIKDRDFLIYGFGINRLRENGTILILCRGIQEDSGIFQREFKQTKTDKYVRGEILIFGFEIKVITTTRVVLRGLCNADPKISFIPQNVINFVSEKFAGDMFMKFIKVANNYEGSEYQNKNPSVIDKEFYDFIQKEVYDIFNNPKDI